MRLVRLAAVTALAGCTSITATGATIANSQWRVTGINGEATPAQPNYRMAFAKGRVSGQFGCNHFGGDYRLRGDWLATGAVSMTEMACQGPGDHFEGKGLAVLTKPMRIEWTGAGRLTLTNAAGAIALERLP